MSGGDYYATNQELDAMREEALLIANFTGCIEGMASRAEAVEQLVPNAIDRAHELEQDDSEYHLTQAMNHLRMAKAELVRALRMISR